MKLNTREITKKFKDHYFKPICLLLAIILFSSHDLYIKVGYYFLMPNQQSTLSLYNGTFENSENIITRDRMLDASLIAHGQRIAIQADQWKDQDSTITQLSFLTGSAGTYVAGVSTKARNIELTADDFNSYLEHDGVLDMLEQRTNNNLLDQDAVESYQKHVKAIFQVGVTKTDDWSTILGYPIEFIPLANPYEKFSGDQLEVELLLDGEPLPNQLVYADYVKNPYAHSHNDLAQNDNGQQHTHNSESEGGHSHTSGQQLRTNDEGIVSINLPEDGIYYLRTIYMVSVTDSDTLTHQSKWATLTFEVTHTHDASAQTNNTSTHTHDDHDHEDGIPTWIFILGSFLIIGVLFLFFRKND